MESLLRWGIEHSGNPDGSTANQQPPRDISKLDPGIIDLILGKPDPVQMKEALAIALDEKTEEDVRVTALDNFEMLIEQIDNANNITSMKMWEPLLSLLDTPSESIRLQTLWILGTAVQNNPKAQEALLSHAPLTKILSSLSTQDANSSPALRSKAVYCLSGLLRHHRAAVTEMEPKNGWKVLDSALRDPDIAVRRKVAFVLNTLLMPDGSTAEQPPSTMTDDITRRYMTQHDIPRSLINSLVGPLPKNDDGTEESADSDFEEKAARALLTYLEGGGKIHPEDAKNLEIGMRSPRTSSSWGLAKEEWDDLVRLSAQAP
ncbi:hsp70 nucleotide exchange factor fes1 [Serendipita sp. 396]|nr:hsp70 nucleotide exchange factor fes1 [Serendipita sp. 396]KAG8787691.1 hsp70 nucleotide exchange factor fes1 [Serendipita sp. 397]KAG8802909.1 hsp70 nucleotide exchange factor fes1 [Serendipita sp. 398]KAG8817229.1 hsp70 nucleotide exchange factor fes1 [Serendipita sp. 401]KAG8873970.1 hsp70 nucleotide exchange factor fes1 [Serendipita sp. 405]KAG9045796.1 hsp70 nucleotide exchange factor fes1 [Serendipita sp. 407]